MENFTSRTRAVFSKWLVTVELHCEPLRSFTVSPQMFEVYNTAGEAENKKN